MFESSPVTFLLEYELYPAYLNAAVESVRQWATSVPTAFVGNATDMNVHPTSEQLPDRKRYCRREIRHLMLKRS